MKRLRSARASRGDKHTENTEDHRLHRRATLVPPDGEGDKHATKEDKRNRVEYCSRGGNEEQGFAHVGAQRAGHRPLFQTSVPGLLMTNRVSMVVALFARLSLVGARTPRRQREWASARDESAVQARILGVAHRVLFPRGIIQVPRETGILARLPTSGQHFPTFQRALSGALDWLTAPAASQRPRQAPGVVSVALLVGATSHLTRPEEPLFPFHDSYIT